MSKSETLLIFSQNLRRLLREHDFTQDDLSKYMSCSKSTVSDWCNGKKMPRMDKIDMMTEFFRCNRSGLLMESVEKSGDNYQLVAIPDHLTAEEMAIIHAYRALNDDDKQFVLATIKRLQK